MALRRVVYSSSSGGVREELLGRPGAERQSRAYAKEQQASIVRGGDELQARRGEGAIEQTIGVGRLPCAARNAAARRRRASRIEQAESDTTVVADAQHEAATERMHNDRRHTARVRVHDAVRASACRV